MNQLNKSIQDCINLLKKEIYPIYSGVEIQSFMRLIFEHLLAYSAIDLVEKRNDLVSEKVFDQLLRIIEDLKSEKPIQYILGYTEFMGYKFFVEDGVLIPRPETEELVDWISNTELKTDPEIIDIGTGSGCIAISLKKIFPQAKVTGLDISKSALKIATRNSNYNNTIIEFIENDILETSFSAKSKKYDIIVSNPPYVTNSEKDFMSKNVIEYEPDIALFVPDNNALVFYEAICEFAKTGLKRGGYIFLEINENLGNDVCDLLIDKGFVSVKMRKDIEGKDRMVRAVYK